MKSARSLIPELINESWRYLYINGACVSCHKVDTISKRTRLCESCELEKISSDERMKAYVASVEKLPSALRPVKKSTLQLSRTGSNASTVIEKASKSKKSAYIAGEVGRGKTTIAALMYKIFSYGGTPVHWVTAQDIVSTVSDASNFDVSDSPSEVVNRYAGYARAGFLFIDDLGTETASKKTVAIVNDLVDNVYRTRDKSRVFISSNKTLDQLQRFYSTTLDEDAGKRIASRLAEMCKGNFHILKGPDFRK